MENLQIELHFSWFNKKKTLLKEKKGQIQCKNYSSRLLVFPSLFANFVYNKRNVFDLDSLYDYEGSALLHMVTFLGIVQNFYIYILNS
jgi:hypothetical protein